MRDVVDTVVEVWRTARSMSRVQVLLRLALLLVGAAALVLPGQPPGSATGVMLVLAAIALLVAVVDPGGIGPVAVLALVAVGWLLAFDLHATPPAWRTCGLAAALYLVHVIAALCASMPASARVERQLLLRWGAHTAVALALGGGLAGIVYGMGELPGSLPLVLIGLVGAVALVAVPVVLARR